MVLQYISPPRRVQTYDSLHNNARATGYSTEFNEATGMYSARGVLAVNTTMDVHRGTFSCQVRLVDETKVYKVQSPPPLCLQGCINKAHGGDSKTFVLIEIASSVQLFYHYQPAVYKLCHYNLFQGDARYQQQVCGSYVVSDHFTSGIVYGHSLLLP